MVKTAVALVGLPGTGKSTAAEWFTETLDADAVGVGDEVRSVLSDHDAFPDRESAVGGKGVGDWVYEQVQTRGRSVFATWLARQLDSVETDAVVVDGVRTEASAEMLDRRFDDVQYVRITTEFQRRLSRVRERGRADAVSERYLRRRDRRAREYGLDRLRRTTTFHHVVHNDESLEAFERTLRAVATVIEEHR